MDILSNSRDNISKITWTSGKVPVKLSLTFLDIWEYVFFRATKVLIEMSG